MTPFAVVLLAMILGLLAWDFLIFRSRNSRLLRFEALVFSIGALFVAFPKASQALADVMGVGRGVDLVIYPLLVWLARETLASRQLRWQENLRHTQLVRSLALADVHDNAAPVETAA